MKLEPTDNAYSDSDTDISDDADDDNDSNSEDGQLQIVIQNQHQEHINNRHVPGPGSAPGGAVGGVSDYRISPMALASLDGLNSGVPTRTTATLTPTTLRSIEQTFIELQCQAEQHSNQAGFVPPSIIPNSLGQQSIGFTGGSFRVSPGPESSSNSGSCSGLDSGSPSASPAPSTSSVKNSQGQAPRRRGMGGRRPARAQPNLSPEEEERRNVRRERNKAAAARCRKRRLDHTNELVIETEGLEKKKQLLQAEIQQLQHEREDLQMILETHRACCRMQASRSPPELKPYSRNLLAETDRAAAYEAESIRVKEEPEMTANLTDSNDIFTSPRANKRVMLSSANPQVVNSPLHQNQFNKQPARPSFLNVPVNMTPAQAHGLRNNPSNNSENAGIAISTPSNGIAFNFDSLMDGGTGLTPVQPCATQQQRTIPEIVSPDSAANAKLVSL